MSLRSKEPGGLHIAVLTRTQFAFAELEHWQAQERQALTTRKAGEPVGKSEPGYLEWRRQVEPSAMATPKKQQCQLFAALPNVMTCTC